MQGAKLSLFVLCLLWVGSCDCGTTSALPELGRLVHKGVNWVRGVNDWEDELNAGPVVLNLTLWGVDPTVVAELDRARHQAEYAHRSLKKSSTVYFLHLHKAGGTTLCEMARKNRYITPGSNCLPEGAGFREWTHFAKWSVDRQQSWAQESRFEFVANEFTPIVNFPNPGKFVFITCVRDPLDRVLSHFRYVKIWFPKFVAAHNGRNFVQPAPKRFPWDTFEQFVKDDHRQLKQTGEVENHVTKFKRGIYNYNFGYSNFQTHMLTNCGTNCTRDDLVKATERLLAFSAVVIIDQWKESVAQLHLLGWANVHHTATGHQNTHSNARALLASKPELLAKMVAWNKWDLQLYNIAVQIAKSRAQEAREFHH